MKFKVCFYTGHYSEYYEKYGVEFVLKGGEENPYVSVYSING